LALDVEVPWFESKKFINAVAVHESTEDHETAVAAVAQGVVVSWKYLVCPVL